MQDFPQAKGTLLTFRHQVSGAQLCYIRNDDPNRAFAVGYRTPMADESDISHVFEHAILSSSEKYPSHSLFFDMINKSYSTSANALTYTGFTFYPVASQSEEQLQKMADVVLSCMVSPGVLTEENFFKKEALRYTLYDPEEPLSMSGTVFVEDLSRMTDTGSNALADVMDTLYPGEYASNIEGRAWANYQLLNYDQALQLYQRCYHFDNALLQLYGDLDYESFLAFLDSEYLSRYPSAGTDLSAYYQPSAGAGYREAVCYSPAYEGDSTRNASVLSYAFDLDGQSYETLVQYDILCQLLNSGDSLFQTNLRAAGLGSASVDLYIDTLKPFLLFQLAGANPEDAPAFRQAVEDTLNTICADGLDEALIQRTLKIGRFSQYLTQESSTMAVDLYFTDIMTYWASTGSTDFFLRQQQYLGEMAGPEGSGMLKQLARTLLDCADTALVTTVPQPGLAEELDARREEYLARKKAGMSPQQLEQLIQDTLAYDQWSQEEVTNSDFTIPVSDLPDPAPLPEFSRQTEEGITFYTADGGTEGIAYNRLLLDASALPQEDLPYLNLFIQLAGSLDTSRHSDTQLEVLKQEYLNGLWVEPFYPSAAAGEFSRPYVRVTWINDPADQAQSLELILELFQQLQLGEQDFLLLTLDALLAQNNPAWQGSYSAAYWAAESAYGADAAYIAYFHGPESYDFLCQLRQQLATDPDALADLQAKLTQIGQMLCQRDHMVSMLVTGEGELEQPVEATRQVLEALPSRPSQLPQYDLPRMPARVAVITEDSLTSTVGEIYLSQDLEDGGVLFPYLMALSDRYLTAQRRYAGLSYTAQCEFTANMTWVSFYSYSDQQAAGAMDTLLGAADALEELELTQEELDGYITNAYSVITQPSTDTQNLVTAMTNDLRGLDPQKLNQWALQVKQTTLEDQQKAAEMLRTLMEQMPIATAGNSAIVQADADRYDAVYDYRQP